jgi:hypothetical protein
LLLIMIMLLLLLYDSNRALSLSLSLSLSRSLMIDVEWGDGLLDTFGLYYVDRPSLMRIAKKSVSWFKNYIQNWERL